MGKVFDLSKFKSTEPYKPAARLVGKRRTAEPFVLMPLWWVERAAPAVRSPVTLVLVELLRAAWRAKSATFPLSNVRLNRLGVTRKVKRRALQDLETVGLIAVERRARRSPKVTLLGF